MASVCALPLVACATTQPSKEELEGLRSEVSQLRAAQAEQNREIARLKAQLEDRGGAVASAMPASATSTTRAEAATTVAPIAPRVPENLKVVFVAPEPLELTDSPRAAASTQALHRKSVGAPAPIPTETELREPVVEGDPAAGLSPEALGVAYNAALAAPDGSALETFARAHRDAPQADNALFEAGIRAEKSGQTDRAIKDFERAVAEHPAGDVVADALLHLAGCQLQLHRTEAARTTLARITHQFPGSAQADAAQTRLTDLGG